MGVLLIASTAGADPLGDLQAQSQILELKALASDLRAELAADGDAVVLRDLERLEAALQDVSDALLEDETSTVIRERFFEVGFLRHRLLHHMSNGDLIVTEPEILLANDLFADLDSYLGDRGLE